MTAHGPHALVFDCDGVLADTERDGHLPAFNQTFGDLGVPVRWSDAEYSELVRIGGGKERMRTLLTPEAVAANGWPSDPDGQADLLATWHRHKTAVYTGLVAEGRLPARPGIARVVAQAAADGWTLAVASTSAEPSVRAVLEHAVGPDLASRFTVLAGDVVAHKKPAPDIYLLALDRLGLTVDDALVVEDSGGGLRAALAAGLRAVVTVSAYTADDDFTGASLVVSSLGDPPSDPRDPPPPNGHGPGVRARVLADPLGLATGIAVRGSVTLADLAAVLAAPRPARDADAEPASASAAHAAAPATAHSPQEGA